MREATLQERFARAIFRRSSPFTYIFIGINLGVFALMWLAGGMNAMSADQEVVLGFGAKENDLIDNQQQYWRLVTSLFIHIGFLHLFFNNYALYVIGQQIELLYGSSRFVLLYLLTGIAGSAASYFYNPEVASAGASGAIFGLFGVMAVFAFRYRKEIPREIQSSIKRQIIPLIVINLIIGFSIPIIDDSAHVGGLIAGIVFGLVIPYKRPQEKKTAVLWRALLVVCLAVIFGSLGAAYSNYSGPPPRLENLTKGIGPRVPPYFQQMVEATKAFGESVTLFQKVMDRKGAKAAPDEALAVAEQGIRTLGNSLERDEQAERYRKRLLEILQRQKGMIEEYAPSKQSNLRDLREEQNAIVGDYNRFREEFDPWLEEFMRKRGYAIEREPASGNK